MNTVSSKSHKKVQFYGRFAIFFFFLVVVLPIIINELLEDIYFFVWLFVGLPFSMFAFDSYYSYKYSQEHSSGQRKLILFLFIIFFVSTISMYKLGYSPPYESVEAKEAFVVFIFLSVIISGSISLAGIGVGKWPSRFIQLSGILKKDIEKMTMAYDLESKDKYQPLLDTFINAMNEFCRYSKGWRSQDEKSFTLVNGMNRVFFTIVGKSLLLFPFTKNGKHCSISKKENLDSIRIVAERNFQLKPYSSSNSEIKKQVEAFEQYKKPLIDLSSLKIRLRDKTFRKAITTPIITILIFTLLMIVIIYREKLGGIFPSINFGNIVLVAIGTAIGGLILGIGRKVWTKIKE